ncbi:MAG: alpha-glucan family phosphorylase [Chloroflexota bacterium]
MVKPVARINVVPDLPEPLVRLRELAYNVRWSWDHETITLFRRLNPELWLNTGHNPVRMLGLISQERLLEASKDGSFMAHFQRVCDDFDAYMNDKNTWYKTTYKKLKGDPLIAYFSMEFGLTESFQNYSGGLGILSGDHLKSASDLDIPLVGVGLLYQEGYFRQYLNADGFQQESYPINDFAHLPLQLQMNKDGSEMRVSVPMPGRELHARVWKVQVGRIPLYLLDSNIEDNSRLQDRNLTHRRTGGDRRTRIRQEVLMGIGGIRMLDQLGLRPGVLHMNEGHSAFLALERIKQLMAEENIPFEDAKAIAGSQMVFTTHTPVPAGLERFGFDLIDEHFTDYYQELGLTREQFIDLGREQMDGYQLFSMPVMAERMSTMSNGVAALHGAVSRNMWQWNYPGVPAPEVPIGSVTNGIHLMTWLSREMASLFDRYLDPEWRVDDSSPKVWEAVYNIPDAELWRTHERRRERLVAFVRQHLAAQLRRRGVSQAEVMAAEEVLNPDALTIGFARRFATYKRATLFMSDIERLSKLANDADRPVQFIFAGKAHPHDNPGKSFIREIDRLSRTSEFRNRLVFLEDYDMNVARYMYQGVDVWLNNPRRPKEASGTSGMKVLANGGLNCSILDGWWAEGYAPELGWAIGNGEEYTEDQWEMQDQIESEALYNVFENDIVPLFYGRTRDGLPRGWIQKMKDSMVKLTPFFNTRRMVREYTEGYYMPTFTRQQKLSNPMSNGHELVEWQRMMHGAWENVGIGEIDLKRNEIKVGSSTTVNAKVYLGSLTPDDVHVQVYVGQLDSRGVIADNAEVVDMKPPKEQESDGAYMFTARVAYDTSGERGLSVRVLPRHEALSSPFKLGLIKWA